jgi:tetratricopeptide (TPR) repeat protein
MTTISTLRRPLLAALLTLLLAPLSLADAVKLDGIWVQDVLVRGFDGGQLVYRGQTGQEVRRPVADLEGLQLEDHPELAEAQEAIDNQRWADAVRPLQRVVRSAAPDHAKQWAGALLVRALDQQGDAVAAATAFADLLRRGAPPALLSVPMASMQQAQPQVRQRAAQAIRPLASRAPAELREPLDQYLQLAQQQAAPTTGTGQTPAGGTGSNGSAGATPQAEGAVVLPAMVDQTDMAPLADQLRAGNFEQALAAADNALTRPGNLMLKLYLKGMAQLGIAEQSGAREDYLDAGLTFMRVVVHFGRGSTAANPIYAASAVEAGYVHQQIGRTDTAAQLFQQAALRIDPEGDPNYFPRLEQLRGGQ